MKLKTKLKLIEQIPKKKCAYCKTKQNLTYDHKIPKIKGGTDEVSNIQVLCKDCNIMKSDMRHDEIVRIVKWYKKLSTDKNLHTNSAEL